MHKLIGDESGAPIGSCLVGTKEFIGKARWFRKLFGGGMRQTGILAASAAFALTHHFPLLHGVHALARKLENGLLHIGANIINRAETCMVRWPFLCFMSLLSTAFVSTRCSTIHRHLD
jgi:threonine aldolase